MTLNTQLNQEEYYVHGQQYLILELCQVFLNVIDGFNAIPFDIPTECFIELDKLILKFVRQM